MEPYWDTVKQIVRESDIILEILDARAVEMSRNEQLEKIIRDTGRPRIYVVNKCDLVSRKDLERALDKLSADREIPSEFIVFFSHKQRRTIQNLLAKIRQVFAKFGKRPNYDENKPLMEKPYREAKGEVIIGVVGYPNVGKSSVINSVGFTHKAKVSSKAGTTHGVHWISAGKDIKFIDTPGVVPIGSFVDEARLGIIAARNPEKLKDPEAVAVMIIAKFLEDGKIDRFENTYKIKIPEEMKEEANSARILEFLSIEKHHLKKGGLPDETRTALNLVKDWQEGKLKLK